MKQTFRFSDSFKVLSRDEMKKINGGKAECQFLVNTGLPGCANQTFPPITYDSDNTDAANIAQNQADWLCRGNGCCSDVDCIGATTPPEA